MGVCREKHYVGEIVEIVAMQRFQPEFSLCYVVLRRGVVTS